MIPTGKTSELPKGETGEVPFTRVLPQVILVSMMFLLTYLDRAMFGPLLPAIEAEFGISHSASTRLLFYMSIGYSFSMFCSGMTSSLVSPRVLVMTALVGSGLALLGISLVQHLLLFAVLVVCLGIAAGQYFNAGLSTMRSHVPLKNWSKAISIHEIGPNASFFLAPILAGLGAAFLGWRGVVTLMGGVSIFAGILFFFLVKGGREPMERVSRGGFARALRTPKFWLCIWLMGIAIAGEFAPFSVLTLHMMEDRLLSEETSVFLLSVSRIGAPIAVLCGGFITTRIGTRRTLIICLLAYAVGMFLMAGPFFVPFVLGIFIQPMLTAMIFPPIFVLIAESFPLEEQPMILAMCMPVASFMGVGLMPSILGVFGDHSSFAVGFAFMGCLVALSLPLVKLMPGNEPRS